MKSLQLFVIYHDEAVLERIPDRRFIKKYVLDSLDTEYQIPSIAENRFLYFLSTNRHFIHTEHVGIAAASWNRKYRRAEPPIPPIESLDHYPPAHNEVLVAAKVNHWYAASERCHPGIRLLIDEICSRNGFRTTGDSFWSNNFICERQVMLDFLLWWNKEFVHFFSKYGEKPPFSNAWNGYKAWLHPAYFYERLTIAYFANQRHLTIRQLNHVNRTCSAQPG